jgi:polysaccharide pyruvyl transferase WcaK-like protein
MPRRQFFLHGIQGVYNYGCEAIVRATARINAETNQDAECIYLSRRPADDRQRLEQCAVQIWDNSPPRRFAPRRLFRRCLEKQGWAPTGLAAERFSGYRPGDVFLLVGGDIITLPPRPYPSTTRLPLFTPCRFAKRKGAKTVLWGASVGPFEGWPESVSAFRQFLDEFDLITVREELTRVYLLQLGVKSPVVAVADPAFLLEPVDRPDDWPFPNRQSPVVAINLSPHSLLYRCGQQTVSEIQEQQVSFVAALRDRWGVNILLVAHVFSPTTSTDDDYTFLESFLQHPRLANDARIKLLPPGLGAQRTKAVLGRCDFLIAARMHCGIGGATMGTPTVFVSYSAKAKGMSRYIYGSDGFCVSLADLCTPDTSQALHDLFDQRAAIRQNLQQRASLWMADAAKGGAALCDLMCQNL